MKHLIIPTLTLCLVGLCITPAFAQDASPSAQEVTQTLKDRVQKVLQSESGKVEGTSTNARTTFGLIGTLQKVVGSTLQIVTVQGTTRIVELDKGATILRAGKVIKFDDVELNSPVLATGMFDSDGTYHVKRLTTLSELPTPTKRVTVLGTLQTLAPSKLALNVTAGMTLPQLSLPYTSKTAFYDLLGTKIDKKNVKVGQQLLTVIAGEYTASASAARVYVLSPIATSAATLK